MVVGAPGKNAANWREKSGYNIQTEAQRKQQYIPHSNPRVRTRKGVPELKRGVSVSLCGRHKAAGRVARMSVSRRDASCLWQALAGIPPGLNDNPEVVVIEGRSYDLIKVPRFKDFYRSRII